MKSVLFMLLGCSCYGSYAQDITCQCFLFPKQKDVAKINAIAILNLKEASCQKPPSGWSRIIVKGNITPAPNENTSLFLIAGLFDKIEYYEAINDTLYLRSVTGKFVRPNLRPHYDASVMPLVSVRDSSVWIALHHYYPAVQRQAIMLKVIPSADFDIWKNQDVRRRGDSFYYYGWLQGAVIAFMIFPLLLFLLNRQNFYLYYVLYLLTVFANDQLEMERTSHLEIWASYHPVWFVIGLNSFQFITVIAYISFFCSFLELPRTLPVLNRWLQYLIYFHIIMFFVDVIVNVKGFLIDGNPAANYLFFWIARIPATLGALLSIIIVQRIRRREVRYVTIGLLTWMIIIMIAFLFNFNVLPITWLQGIFLNPYIFIHIGVLIELTFFSWALSNQNYQHVLERWKAEKAKTDATIEHQREKEQIARDLHDEVGSTLSSISILGDATLQNLETGLGKNRMAIISERARQVMDTMSDIVWSVNPKNDELDSIVMRMREFAVETLEAKGILLHFAVDEDLHLLQMPMERRKDFYLIFKEAINNAAKYAQAQHVWVTLEKLDKALHLDIRDDGIGFDSATIKQGNGLRNMQARAERLGAIFTIKSKIGVGTTIHLSFPITS